ncbi:hypothetical protein GCM10027168_30800 [Streptomyces capparidis]
MQTGLDAGTYEVLRDRLAARAADLVARAEALNARRVEVFGATETRLAGTGRVTTDAPRVPRDLVAVGGLLLIGYHTPGAGAGQPAVGDVFALHRPDLTPAPADALPGLLDDPAFVREFQALHRYYRQASLHRLRLVDGRLLAVFRTGPEPGDIRVLRWSVAADGTPAFLDARGDRDHTTPPAHDVEWIPATRDDHVPGRHPHIRVAGEVFVSTVGGTLTVKLRDDTETPDGVHTEPVDDPLQALADAEVAHARVGPLLLLRVHPYREPAPRHLVVNTVTKEVRRLDAIGVSCRRLPDGQGIVFPGGHCLATGAVRTFDTPTAGLAFERAVHSPHGEDVLYVFHSDTGGHGLLLPYHRIRKDIAHPLRCRGHALLDDGTLVVLPPRDERPGRAHTLQVWRTPFVSDLRAAAGGDGPLERVGNADLVRGIADCLSVARDVAELTPSAEVYETLAAACARVADTHHWLGDPDLGDPLAPLTAMRETAQQVLTEYRAVRDLTERAGRALDECAADIAGLVRRVRGEPPRDADGWVERLTGLRRAQGRLATLRDTRYADTGRVDELARSLAADLATAGERAVAFLAREDAFAGHHREAERLTADAEAVATVARAAPVAERIEERAADLRAVAEVVTGLEITDATLRAAVLERIADVLAGLNRARATLQARRGELGERESRAEFAAELALLGQSFTGALAAADTPEACDDHLARLLLHLEDLEARFAGSDALLTRIADRRDEIHGAFTARGQALADARSRRAERLADSAARALATVTRRAAQLPDTDAVNTHFASDPMAGKVHRAIEELRGLGEQVRADELEGRLAAAREQAARALRDRADLYGDDGTTLRLGRHRFAVTTRTPELTLVPHGDGLALALTGTDYRRPVTDPDLTADRACWNRLLPSESDEVYRAEHLAARLLAEHGPERLAAADDLAALVRRAAQERHDEGYERGIHDHDATAVLTAVLRLYEQAGPLRHPPAARAAAQLFWAHGTTPRARAVWARRAASLARARAAFGPSRAIEDLRRELAEALAPSTDTPEPAAEYLFEELAAGPAEGFTTGAAARALLEKFHREAGPAAYEEDVRALLAAGQLPAARALAEGWLTAFTAAGGDRTDPGDLAEAVAVALCPELPRRHRDARLTATVEGLLGTHPRLDGRTLTVRIDEFLARTRAFADHDVPAFRAHRQRRAALVAAERARLRLDEHRPRPLTTFVRSRLLDEVYLPLVGDSLAKQLGTAGAGRRTDTGGLLLLLSPPGYGKTTLVEYVADRLGLLLVKVSGPALGRTTTSLDPAAAPDATSRRELEKIDFALSAGSNVLLYLDDIQHTSPELLQRFIPLCDATRTLNGHDLRGKRFAVCMSGNPHTATGHRFRVPDMLANRADVWDLGDVLTGKEDVFALSFVENALTANPVLAPLAGVARADLELLIRLAERDPAAAADRLTRPWAPAELDRVLAVLRHLLTARATVLAVNAAHIASAARTDATRTEPPFLLQGSYRTMNRIAERLVPAMDDAELSAVIDDHYAAEARTLTGDAEANLLKLAELRGTLTPEQAARWADVKRAHVRAQAPDAPDDAPAARAVTALGLLADRLTAVEAAILHTSAPGVAPCHSCRP